MIFPIYWLIVINNNNLLMNSNISFNEAAYFSGYLEKKSPSMFGGWQKRFFRILEGKLLTYFEKDSDKEPKGAIDISSLSNIMADGQKV